MQGDYSIETPHKQCCLSCGCYWYSKEKIPIDADPAKTLCLACNNHCAIKEKDNMHDNSDKSRLERAMVILEENRKEMGKLETERNEIRELYQFQYGMWYHGSLLKAMSELISLRLKQWYCRHFQRSDNHSQGTPTAKGG